MRFVFMLAFSSCATGVNATANADANANANAYANADAHADSGLEAHIEIDAAVDAPPPTPDPLIDDLEDGDDWIRPVAGRAGSWYPFNDGTATGMQTPTIPTPNGANGSLFCAHTSGQGFVSWGS